ncbi:MFS transporter [Aquibacillus salsiterrae]|uniref:MFS transporter n=1 Tax=Aquibacillus salsiterrae TaxID=2950439 RepID=A0A9X3WGK7_9BACI|nr:MFS transporter [Aquibacillus salsiterrae]MDC3418041.1 MFS transporter [Aquibacillus salsiterrae]
MIWLMRTFYFNFFLSVGAFQFVNLFYVNFGLNSGQIGLLFAIGPFVLMFAQPLWGLITDFLGSPKLTLIIMTIGATITALFFPLATGFTHLLLLNIGYFFFQSAIPPIADVTVISLLDDTDDYGKIRLWGSLGYAVSVLVIGRLLDLFGLTTLFFLHSAFLLVAFLLVLKIPIKANSKKRFKAVEAVGLFKNRTFIALLLFSFFLQLTVHANNSFYAIYLQNLGSTVTIVGIALLIKSILEIPFFAMSKKLMDKYSYPVLLSLVAVMYAIRWLFLGFSNEISVLVGSQILLSLSFSIQYFVAVAYVNAITPPNYRATGQTIYWAVTLGLSGVVGNLLAGWLLNYVTISSMYKIAMVVALLAVPLIWLKPFIEESIG